LSPEIAKILAQSLQRYNLPFDWARKLFKPSTDSASLLVEIEKKIFVLGLWFSGGGAKRGVSFSFFWPSLRSPGHQCNEPIVSLNLFFETRLLSEPLEPLIDFLAYLIQNYATKTKKWSKFLPLQKETRGW